MPFSKRDNHTLPFSPTLSIRQRLALPEDDQPVPPPARAAAGAAAAARAGGAAGEAAEADGGQPGPPVLQPAAGLLLQLRHGQDGERRRRQRGRHGFFSVFPIR